MKLENEHKHILGLINRDAGDDGWAAVSEMLYTHLSQNMPAELITFEKLSEGGRARLTDEGINVIRAMSWL